MIIPNLRGCFQVVSAKETENTCFCTVWRGENQNPALCFENEQFAGGVMFYFFCLFFLSCFLNSVTSETKGIERITSAENLDSSQRRYSAFRRRRINIGGENRSMGNLVLRGTGVRTRPYNPFSFCRTGLEVSLERKDKNERHRGREMPWPWVRRETRKPPRG